MEFHYGKTKIICVFILKDLQLEKVSEDKIQKGNFP